MTGKKGPTLGEYGETENNDKYQEKLDSKELKKIGYYLTPAFSDGNKVKLVKKWDTKDIGKRPNMKTDTILDIVLEEPKIAIKLAKFIENKIGDFKNRLNLYLKESFIDNVIRYRGEDIKKGIYNKEKTLGIDFLNIDSIVISPQDIGDIFLLDVNKNSDFINSILYKIKKFMEEIKIETEKNMITNITRQNLGNLKKELLS